MALINPTLPSAGGGRGAQEVVELAALTTIRDTLNGSLDPVNLSKGPYDAAESLIFEHYGRLTNADLFGLKIFDTSGSPVGVPVANPKIPGLIVPAVNPWSLSGKTPKLRVRWSLASNNAAFDAHFDTQVQLRLCPVTISGTAGSLIVTPDTVNALCTESAFPNRSAIVRPTGPTISVPAAGLYVFTGQVVSPLDSLPIPAGGVCDLYMRIGLTFV